LAELQPLRGLRYSPSLVGDVSSVIAPPYDVISDEAQRALYDRSPYNVVRLEYGTTDDAATNRYEAASSALAAWRQGGVLELDAAPSLYLYEQRFALAGRSFIRHSILGRVRLEPWDRGVILPHEHTLSGPKEDRLQLLRACRTNVSPVFALYRTDGDDPLSCLQATLQRRPVAEAVDSAGQAHRLWLIDEPDAIGRLQEYFSTRTVYVADGHHRYETALTYRDECRAGNDHWTGDEPENFALMALTAADDPGLLVLPIHRLVRPISEPANLRAAVEAQFELTDADLSGDAGQSLASLLGRARTDASGRAAFVAVGLTGGAALLRPRRATTIESAMPAGHSAAWRQLAVNVLQYGILEPLLAIDMEALRAGKQVSFTESAEHALGAVASGEFPLAFLLEGTRPEEIFAVADAGDRMPQKSTYFYPKLGTGLVLYAMDAHAGSGVAAV